MRKQDLQNEKLDRAGSRLIKAARISSDEIEEIVHSPQLFNSVKARIKADEYNRHKKFSIFGTGGFGFWNWQKSGAALAVVTFLFFSVLSILIFRKQASMTAQNNPPDIQSPSIAVNASQSLQNSGTSPQKQSSDEMVNEPSKFVQKATFKPQFAGVRKPVQRTRAIKQQRQEKEESEGEFIQLTFAGNEEQTSEDAQIIRVEIPRSSLTALGVRRRCLDGYS